MNLFFGKTVIMLLFIIIIQMGGLIYDYGYNGSDDFR